MNKHGENRRALRHVHIPNAALHPQTYTAVKESVPAFAHSDEIQCRDGKVHIPSVNPSVPELAVVQVLHLVDTAFHLFTAR